jgi:hypothetical protein
VEKFTFTDTEFISSNSFARISDVVFSEVISENEFKDIKSIDSLVIDKPYSEIDYLNTKFDLKENYVIFCNTEYLETLFTKLNKVDNLNNLKLITQWSDRPITKKLFNQKPKCISNWYASHVDYNHDNLHPIPLGLSGDYSPKNLLKKHFVDFYKLETQPNKENLLYVNFQQNTNNKIRGRIFDSFSKRSWVKIDKPNKNLSEYLYSLASSKFVLCPFGNGYDTHRLWEVLYAGSIPVVENHITYEATKDLPVLKIDSFNNLNEKKLNDFYDQFENQDFSFESLKIEYWNSLIRQENTTQNQGNTFSIRFTKFEQSKIKISRKISMLFKRNLKKINFRINQIKNLFNLT